MTNKLTEEQKLKNVKLVYKLIAKFEEPRKKYVEYMLDGPVGEMYFTAPASTKEDYHDCTPGGLCHHSLKVVRNLKSLAEDLCPDKWSFEKLAFVGLFHDLGKIGDGEVDRYIPNPSAYQRREYGKLFTINPEMKWMTHADGSLFLLQEYGIKLDWEEWTAIKLHDGQMSDENRQYRMRESKLALLLHWADIWDAQAEKPL